MAPAKDSRSYRELKPASEKGEAERDRVSPLGGELSEGTLASVSRSIELMTFLEIKPSIAIRFRTCSVNWVRTGLSEAAARAETCGISALFVATCRARRTRPWLRSSYERLRLKPNSIRTYCSHD